MKNPQKIHAKEFIFWNVLTLELEILPKKWTVSQMILKNTYLKGHLLVAVSKWRWFYDV